MKMKRILGLVLVAALLIAQLSVYSAGSGEELLFDMDFTNRSILEKPANVFTTNIPRYGNVGFDYKGDGKTTAFTLEDTSESGGVTAALPLPELSGKFTIHSKFTFGNVTKLDFYDGIKTSFQSNGFRIYKGASKLYLYSNTAEQINPFPKLNFAAGNEIEMWACVDTYKKSMDLYLKADAFGTYKSAMIDGATLEGDVFCLHDLKIATNRINAVTMTASTGTGKNYIDFIRAYRGFVVPSGEEDITTEKAKETESVSEVLMPVKAPWFTREETRNYLRDNVTTFLADAMANAQEPEVIVPTGEKYMPSMDAINQALEKMRGTHPRIMFDAAGLEEYKTKFNNPAYAKIKDSLLASWESNLNTDLFVYDASLSDGKFRVVGDVMFSLAMAYVVTGEQKYLDRTLEWIEIAVSLPMYGDGMGIAASHILFGMGMAYDLLYYELSQETKDRMETAMLSHGAYLWQYWKNDHGYLHNFGYTIACAFAAVPLALFDEEGCEQSMEWLYRSNQFIATALEVMSPDGCSPEGTGYFSYGFSYLTQYLLIAEKWGFDPWQCEGYINAVRNYRVHMSFPYNSWTGHDHTAQFGDAYGYDFSSMLTTMYYVASNAENCETVTWLANELFEKGYCGFDSFTLLFYDLNLPEKTPAENGYPTMGYMPDFGYVFTRSDWSGDESAIYFQCGFNGGEHAIPYLRAFPEDPDFGFGHNEPNANHFLLYNKGDQLLVTDSYSYKLTSQHNTLTVNERGQLGDDTVWYEPPMLTEGMDWEPPYVKKAISYDTYDYFVGAAANAYPEELGVEKFNRHMIYIKPNALVVVDDIRVKEESDLKLRFFPGVDSIHPVENGFLAQGKNTNMFVENLTPEQSSLSLEKQGIYINRNPVNQRGFECLTVAAQDDALINVTAFSWSDSDKFPSKVSMKQDGYRYTFTVDGKDYVVNIQNLTSEVRNAEKKASPEENKLTSLMVENIPVALQEGVYDYNFNLDDYYLTARSNKVELFAMDEQRNSDNVKIDMPPVLPGKATVTLQAGSEEKVYTVNIQKTALTNLERISMTPLNDTNAFSNSWLPSNLTSSSTEKGWRTATTANHPTFDLGEVTEIVGFDIGWMKNMDDGFDFIFKVSEDGVNFVEAYRGQADTGDYKIKYFEIPGGMRARYVEFIVDARVSSYCYEVSTLGFYKKKG